MDFYQKLILANFCTFLITAWIDRILFKDAIERALPLIIPLWTLVSVISIPVMIFYSIIRTY